MQKNSVIPICRNFKFTLILMICLGLVFLSAQKAAAKFGNNGVVTTLFDTGITSAASIILQPDGKLAVAGYTYGTNFYFALARYNSNGSLDSNFGSNGTTTTVLANNGNCPGANRLILQPDGKLVAAGCDNYNFALARYNRDGSLDTSFGTAGKVNLPIAYGSIIYGLSLQPDGKFITAGQRYSADYNFALARYNSDGSLDLNFGNNGMVFTNVGGFDGATDLVLQPDGKIVATGFSSNYTAFALVCYDHTGGLDASFGTGGIVQTSMGGNGCACYGAVLQPDGKIATAGYIDNGSNNYDFALARYTSAGNLDTNFNSTGKVITHVGNYFDSLNSLILQPDGKLVVTGVASNGSNFDFILARYTSTGALDTSFNGTGMVITSLGSGSDMSLSLVLQPDGKLVAAGSSDVGSNSAFALVRYTGNGSLDTQDDLPLLLEIKPDHAVAGQTVTLDIHGWNLDDVINVQLRNSSGSVNGTMLSKMSSRITAQITLPSVAGLYDLNLAKNLINQTSQSVFNVQEPLAQPAQWHMLDLGKAGNPIAGPCGLAIGDARQVGLNEIYVANSDKCLYIYQKGVAWAVTPMAQEAGYFQDVILSDVNLDGKWEVYGANSLPQIFQYQWAGNNWSKSGFYASSGPLAKGYLAGGGLAELYSLSGSALEQSRLFNQTWSNNPVAQGAGAMLCSVIGDADNDQDNELYAANADKNLYQYKYYDSHGYPGWYVSTTIYAGTQNLTCLALGDLDKNGANELYASNLDGKIYQFKCAGASWSGQAINSTSLVANKIVISDADNDGTDELYAAGQDGHAYQFKLVGAQWQMTDLGNAGAPLIALAVGDGDNSHQYKVYALSNNARLYQFWAQSSLLTPTPTPLITPTPAPTSLSDADKKLIVFHNQINPNHGERARIRWYQPDNASVSLVIYNLLGDKVATLATNGQFPPGQLNEISWNGKTSRGALAGSGIYLVYLQTGKVKAWAKLAIVK